MKSLNDAEVAVIGGTGLESLLVEAEKLMVGTPYGFPPKISVGKVSDKRVAFLPRHGWRHSVPPHRINYRANIYALYKIGVKRIIATNAVGAINPNMKPGDLVVPHDIIDFTRRRRDTFYDDYPVIHIDFTEPYCPEIRKLLIEKSIQVKGKVWSNAIYVCTEGPRFETPAEIKAFKILGCDIVGMTGATEAVLARELQICYAALCFVSNMAAGIAKRVTSKEVIDISKSVIPKIKQILIEVIQNFPKERSCPCTRALEDAEV